ncbi:ATP-binding protein [Actinokineospora inagensis]|uniref:ATP-binding protein n=1 Tax=Actinokineospora inagensis TaxID=103730 RepID=UPI0003FE25A7|nr:ATP-binding protein [Actinokineospora inagensis]
MTTFEGFRCWTAESVRETVYSDIGALPSEADALFLAAHTPMSLVHLRGTEIVDGDGSERDVLKALQAGFGDANRNTLIAVTGESGAGKSHVVRWVHAHLPTELDNCHVLYVPRAIQTIRDLLRSIVVGLPADSGHKLMARVENAIGGISEAQLRDRLLEETRFALTWTLPAEEAAPDETEDEREARQDRNLLLGEPDDNDKRRHGLADLLQVTKINEALLRPGGTLDDIVKSLFAEVSRRDNAGFQLGDLPIGVPGIRSAVSKYEELSELWDLVSQEPQQALDVLNRAVESGLATAIGLNPREGETLDDLFREARQTLRAQGKELVLLFEDLAQFGFISGELYDQFATQPGTDMAPLRAVFAVTDGPFKKIVRTVNTRITHQFAVSDTALPRRDAFIARYLNLVRLGHSRVDAAWRRADRDDDTWLPNACDSGPDGAPCPVRAQCHSGFGNVAIEGLGEVGLYPYNAVALRRALDRPTTPDKPRTPRSDIDVCVSETLVETHAHLGRGTFPHERVFTRFDHEHELPKAALDDGRAGEEGARYFRTAVLWGDVQRPNPVVLAAFGLAGTNSTDAGSTKSAKPDPPAAPKPAPRPQTAATPAGAPATQARKQKSPLQPLFQWESGSQLTERDVKKYRSALYTLVLTRVDLDRDLINLTDGLTSELFSGYFKVTSFHFGVDAYGQRAGTDSITFDLERRSEDVKVLAAARWYVDHGHWDPEQGDWEWPTSYTTLDLMVSLETRLDEWAETVRTGFLAKVRVKDLARAALGVHAVALLCTGTDPRDLRTVRAALANPVAVNIANAWADVANLARSVLGQDTISEIIEGFTGSRQGAGATQLVDVATLEIGLRQAVTTPSAFLDQVVNNLRTVEPRLVKAAKEMLTAIRRAGAALVDSVTEAQGVLTDTLQGAKPRLVVGPAQELARQALTSGLFRPAEGRNAFLESVDVLQSTPDDLPLTWRPSDGSDQTDNAVHIQSWAGAAIRAAGAMAVVHDAVLRTEEECRRNTPESDDMERLEQRVQGKLDELTGLLARFGSEAGALDG